MRKIAPWSCSLTEQEFERARRAIQERRVMKGTHISEPGRQSPPLVGLSVGTVKVCALSRAGRETTLHIVSAQAWLGELGPGDQETEQQSIVALTDARIATMSHSTFAWLVENSAPFNRFLVDHLSKRLAQFTSLIKCDRLLDPAARLAGSISRLIGQSAYVSASARLDLTQEEMALVAGLSRQTVSECLRILEDQGLLRLERGRVVILDCKRLHRYDTL
jgi:CRP-like cAMP-binding protein